MNKPAKIQELQNTLANAKAHCHMLTNCEFRDEPDPWELMRKFARDERISTPTWTKYQDALINYIAAYQSLNHE